MKFLTSAWMVLITLLILTTVRWWDPGPVQRLRLMNFDGYQHLLTETVSDKIVLYDIGEEFLKEHGQWPPKRTVFAQLTADLYNAGQGWLYSIYYSLKKIGLVVMVTLYQYYSRCP